MKIKMEDKQVSEIVEIIRKEYSDKQPKHSVPDHTIREYVFLHLVVSEILQNTKLTFGCDKDTRIENLQQALEKVSRSLELWQDEFNLVSGHLSMLTKSMPQTNLGDQISVSQICIHKIDSLIPNGDKLGELIDKVQGRVPNMPALNRSQCHHLGKMLCAAMKENGQ